MLLIPVEMELCNLSCVKRYHVTYHMGRTLYFIHTLNKVLHSLKVDVKITTQSFSELGLDAMCRQ